MAEITNKTKKPLITTSQIATIIFAVLVGTVVAHYDDFLPYRWHTFDAVDGSFSAQFPGRPKIDELRVTVAGGTTTVIHEISAEPTTDSAYILSYFEDSRLANGSAKDALDSERDGSISKVQGTVTSERHIIVDGYPAQDVEAHARGNSLMHMRLVAANRRMYMLMVIETDRERPDAKNIRKFFDSVRFSR